MEQELIHFVIRSRENSAAIRSDKPFRYPFIENCNMRLPKPVSKEPLSTPRGASRMAMATLRYGLP